MWVLTRRPAQTLQSALRLLRARARLLSKQRLLQSRGSSSEGQANPSIHSATSHLLMPDTSKLPVCAGTCSTQAVQACLCCMCRPPLAGVPAQGHRWSRLQSRAPWLPQTPGAMRGTGPHQQDPWRLPLPASGRAPCRCEGASRVQCQHRLATPCALPTSQSHSPQAWLLAGCLTSASSNVIGKVATLCLLQCPGTPQPPAGAVHCQQVVDGCSPAGATIHSRSVGELNADLLSRTCRCRRALPQCCRHPDPHLYQATDVCADSCQCRCRQPPRSLHPALPRCQAPHRFTHTSGPHLRPCRCAP